MNQEGRGAVRTTTSLDGFLGSWSYTKEKPHKYHVIKKDNYLFYLKKIGFEFNHRNESIFNLLFKTAITLRRDGKINREIRK